MTKLCRTPAEVILNHANPNAHGTGQGEAHTTKFKPEDGDKICLRNISNIAHMHAV
jgi:hypothetical protein